MAKAKKVDYKNTDSIDVFNDWSLPFYHSKINF